MQQQRQQTQQVPQASSKASYYNNAMIQSLRNDNAKTPMLRDEELRYGQAMTLMYRELIGQASRKFVGADNKRGNTNTGTVGNLTGVKDKDPKVDDDLKVKKLKKDNDTVTGDKDVTGKETSPYIVSLLTNIGSGLKHSTLFNNTTKALSDLYDGLKRVVDGVHNSSLEELKLISPALSELRDMSSKVVPIPPSTVSLFDNADIRLEETATKYKVKADSIFDKYSEPPLNRSTRLESSFDDLTVKRNNALAVNTQAFRKASNDIIKHIGSPTTTLADLLYTREEQKENQKRDSIYQQYQANVIPEQVISEDTIYNTIGADTDSTLIHLLEQQLNNVPSLFDNRGGR